MGSGVMEEAMMKDIESYMQAEKILDGKKHILILIDDSGEAIISVHTGSMENLIGVMAGMAMSSAREDESAALALLDLVKAGIKKRVVERAN